MNNLVNQLRTPNYFTSGEARRNLALNILNVLEIIEEEIQNVDGMYIPVYTRERDYK